MCGRHVRLTAHHDSYEVERRLTIIWLCGKCHAFLHKQRDGYGGDRWLGARRRTAAAVE